MMRWYISGLVASLRVIARHAPARHLKAPVQTAEAALSARGASRRRVAHARRGPVAPQSAGLRQRGAPRADPGVPRALATEPRSGRSCANASARALTTCWRAWRGNTCEPRRQPSAEAPTKQSWRMSDMRHTAPRPLARRTRRDPAPARRRWSVPETKGASGGSWRANAKKSCTPWREGPSARGTLRPHRHELQRARQLLRFPTRT